MSKKVGVYVCHCGGNISDVIKVKEVAEQLKKDPNVSISTDYVFMCSDAGQKMIVDDLNSGKIDKVVVAACSPALHELTFRKCMMRANRNAYQFEHVNIREQASWVHKSKPAEATKKAALLVQAGINKIVLQDELSPINVDALQSVLIIGGGLGGMNSALALAKKGLQVFVIEKNAKLGGNLLKLDSVYSSSDSAKEIVEKLEKDLRSKSNIQIITGATVISVDGFVGNFEVKLSNNTTLKAGAIIIATGSKSHIPPQGELGFGSNKKVILMPDFLEAYPTLLSNGSIKSVAFIHCVGSRQSAGPNEYCSRICCTQALHTISQVQKKFPEIQIYDLYRDIRTYGRTHEAIYEEVSKDGAIFFRFSEDAPPQVLEDKIIVNDILTWNQEIEINPDLVVLVTGIEAFESPDLKEMLKLPVGADRFLQEAHPKLRPVEIASNGVYLAGTCQAPMDILETVAAGTAAASKAAILLGKGIISLDPYVAQVRADKCIGCAKCIPECSYTGAIAMNEKNIATIVPALCKGCGACVAVCPTRAIDLAGWSLDQFDAMIDAIAEVSHE